MRKLFFGIIASLALASPALAQTIQLPRGVKVEPITVGNTLAANRDKSLVSAFVSTKSGTVYQVTFGDCRVSWKNGDVWYLIAIDGLGIFMTPADDFSVHLEDNGYVFEDSLIESGESGHLCTVTDAKKQ